ncbi:MAG: hypothetical protein D6715_06645 [Calditrichaeota bacterium]|nr:MAG: hypothetical protein D6715_06645 [Calditrichota bacterium]
MGMPFTKPIMDQRTVPCRWSCGHFTGPALWPLVIGVWFLLSLQGCAIRQAPPGGPEDRQPPQVIATFPTRDSTGVKALDFVEFRFSEGVEKGSLSGQVWIQPALPGPLQLKWKGNRKLRILISDSLRKNQTYLVTLGPEIKDLRGNRMGHAYVLAFSTGNKIHHGRIRGRVEIPQGMKNVQVVVYPMDSTTAAVPIADEPAPYFVPAGTDGTFKLDYLPEGTYRVFALADQNLDRRYQLGQDWIALPPADVVLDSLHQQVSGMNLRLFREDTLPPRLLRAGARNVRTAVLRFNEPIRLMPGARSQVQDSLSHAPLPVRGLSVDPEETAQVLVFVDSLQERPYRGWLTGLADTTGNGLQPDSLAFQFSGATLPDTVRPRLVLLEPAPGATGVHYASRLHLRFTQPVQPASLFRAVHLLGPDSLPVAFEWQLPTLFEAWLKPDSLLSQDARYRLVLPLGEIKTVWGEPYGDSTRVDSFRTVPFSEVGEISGMVGSDRPEWAGGYVVARSAGAPEKIYSARFRVGRPYLLRNLPDGLYRLHCWMDVNENGRLDPGSTHPFQFAEPVVFYPDTVRVRKRWTTEGINFQFKF